MARQVTETFNFLPFEVWGTHNLLQIVVVENQGEAHLF